MGRDARRAAVVRHGGDGGNGTEHLGGLGGALVDVSRAGAAALVAVKGCVCAGRGEGRARGCVVKHAELLLGARVARGRTVCAPRGTVHTVRPLATRAPSNSSAARKPQSRRVLHALPPPPPPPPARPATARRRTQRLRQALHACSPPVPAAAGGDTPVPAPARGCLGAQASLRRPHRTHAAPRRCFCAAGAAPGRVRDHGVRHHHLLGQDGHAHGQRHDGGAALGRRRPLRRPHQGAAAAPAAAAARGGWPRRAGPGESGGGAGLWVPEPCRGPGSAGGGGGPAWSGAARDAAAGRAAQLHGHHQARPRDRCAGVLGSRVPGFLCGRKADALRCSRAPPRGRPRRRIASTLRALPRHIVCSSVRSCSSLRSHTQEGRALASVPALSGRTSTCRATPQMANTSLLPRRRGRREDWQLDRVRAARVGDAHRGAEAGGGGGGGSKLARRQARRQPRRVVLRLRLCLRRRRRVCVHAEGARGRGAAGAERQAPTRRRRRGERDAIVAFEPVLDVDRARRRCPSLRSASA